ncbi:dienelactone hydrolase family protein [Streptomyces albipurpureus]|uniref:Dienelactone hydrolase family protein n=1 Tax=Streptomyces albipurpureus TaxID=2897419 RepID=A0ABT0UZV4_9ACTN|nr:dienelactone hydrolase family protein [Streptomyces sp. CWNU-1]MCM2393771.1 dienelactone hydrolase family protein [Streptomyces sp. CWNU-1]
MTTMDLEYSDGPLTLRGFLAYDESVSEPRPGVLVASDAFGLGDQARERAQLLSRLGYPALALDMYGDGRQAASLPEGIALVDELKKDPETLRRRARAGLSALAAQPQVDGARLGAIGFCFGGTVALELARDAAPLRAAVSFHGSLGTERPAEPGEIRARVLVCHGAADPLVAPESVAAFQDEMRDAHADWQVNIYGGAKHSFTNPASDHYGMPGIGYDERADRRSWAAMLALFQESFAIGARL